ncbi:micrococcal nuclease [Leucobacter luti]|uniref:Micrococcal nuclease n=1 Tax=Leucobacter luti TaxID=340320 RepID=A0A4R6S7I8_9MICO|nr:thermonuclease family protein [Leucobacter luti]TDP95363.1 micrococcal nuclease [Leucobacter luti]
MRIRKQVRRVIYGGVTVAIAAAVAWAYTHIPGQVTNALDTLPSITAESPQFRAAEPVTLERVVDGDTIVISYEVKPKRVRIIGIDTPELGRGAKADECYAQEGTQALTALLAAGSIELVSDPSQGDTDKYGRLLRHVTVDGRSVAVEMLVAGMGHEYTYSAPYAGTADHWAAETAAREAGAGLW